MRTDSIIRELLRRVREHQKIASEAFFVTDINSHEAAAKALRNAITLIESYEMSGMEDETETTQVQKPRSSQATRGTGV